MLEYTFHRIAGTRRHRGWLTNQWGLFLDDAARGGADYLALRLTANVMNAGALVRADTPNTQEGQ